MHLQKCPTFGVHISADEVVVFFGPRRGIHGKLHRRDFARRRGVCGYAVIEVSEDESGYHASVLKAVTLRESVDRAEADARIAKAKADAA